MTIAEPYSNHNGGWIAFNDSYLYFGTDDGGSGGDPGNRAQSLKSLLGKILRIDPRDPDGHGPLSYSIPSGNPYVDRAGKDEIWSYGLRNPWRCSFDSLTGNLWCGDVGQNAYEDVDRVNSGKAVNFGWRLLEGHHYYRAAHKTRGTLCTSRCKKPPIAEYAHSAFGGGNCAVTGGYVSRRAGAAMLGKYIFGDFCSGKVWQIAADFRARSRLSAPVAHTGFKIRSLGEGADGRIYLVDLAGAVYLVDQS